MGRSPELILGVNTTAALLDRGRAVPASRHRLHPRTVVGLAGGIVSLLGVTRLSVPGAAAATAARPVILSSATADDGFSVIYTG